MTAAIGKAAAAVRSGRAVGLAALLVALLALAAIGTGLWRLNAATAGLAIETLRVGEIPVTVYRPATAGTASAPAPVVVIAHGFAGSQQLMQPYAVTLARNGYIAVTFDFPGHGHNPAPFVARLEDEERRIGVLLGALERVVGFATGLPGADGRLALLGHSMAGDVLLRYATAHRDQVVASVLLSPYMSPHAPQVKPRDVLFVFGALEPEMLHQAGREAVAAASGAQVASAAAVQPGLIYGDLADGSARELVFAPGVEHIGVLYGRGGIGAALDWLNRALGHRGDGFIDARGGALGLLFLGIVALAWPLSRLLPRAATRTLGAGLGWRRLLPAAIAPAVLTPLILRVLPSDYLPILLGDYLALHFGVYGVLTLLGIWFTPAQRDGEAAPAGLAREPGRVLWTGLLVGTLATAAYLTLAITLPLDQYVTAFMPGAGRLWIVLGILPGTLAYFAADGWLTHGEGSPWAAPILTKTLFLLSLLGAVALNLSQLFFLIIIIPAILAFFLLYGLIGGWVYRRTRHPLVGAIAIGLAFAWSIAVTFPVVD
ncbi:alpha/beta fold hydrolase [uncultured Thiodictyon sp.]|jgi:dienelactone hydrolase|uniref:alpha/beta hydrolase n=1 Tax=uncultured Thiodictyon sp. TaxID=1846217 RepID=UPI0025F562E4|nr:alpha/beta fold hydrolase [uncultured Thiodictyon sp.]